MRQEVYREGDGDSATTLAADQMYYYGDSRSAKLLFDYGHKF